MMPHASTAASRRAAIVSIGIKWALVLLVILNLLQLNLLYFSSSGSTRCILKAALATRARTGDAAAPPAAPVLPGSPLGSYEQLGNPVATHLQKTRSGRYALFVIYAWNYEVLLTAVRSYVAAGFGKSLIILDNTSNSTLMGDPVIAELAAEVIPARTRLTFSQAQNFIADVAIERGYEYYFWGHSDVAVLGKDESASFADDVIACVEASYRSRPSWGIIYFNYDWFSAIRTDLVRQVKYDTFVTVYMSDCDFYPRVRAAGYETLNYPQMCPSTHVEVYDINRPLDIPWNDFDRAQAILEHHRDSEANRFEWKMDAMEPGEKAGWDLWERSSYLYFLAKWGPRQEGQPHCKIEVKEPITGNLTLPQEPFGHLGYLQRFWVQEDPYFDKTPILAGLGRQEEAEPDEAAAAPSAADGESAGSPSGAELSILQPGDDVEVVTESDNRLQQIQAAHLGVAASQLASAASGVLTQPGDSSPQQAAGTAEQGPLRREAANGAGKDPVEAEQHSSLDSLDEELKAYDPLMDEKLAAGPDQDLSKPDADNAQDQGALDLDAELRRDNKPDQGRQADTGAADTADDGSPADEDTAAGQQRDSGKGIQELLSRGKAAQRDKPTVIHLGDDTAVSENAEELYPEDTRAGVWGGLDQDSGNEAEEELDAEGEEGLGVDELLDSEDVDAPGQDESDSRRYYSGDEMSREQADDEDYDAEYADQPDGAEYADQPEDDEYADQAGDETLEQDYTDLPEGMEAEETGGSEDTGRGSGAIRVKPGTQAETRSRGAEVADSDKGPEPGASGSAGKRVGNESGSLQEDASAAADVDGMAAKEDAPAAGKNIEAAEVDVGPVDELELEEWDGEEEFSDPADLGLDELDMGDELDDELGLEDQESEEDSSAEEADLPDEGSADQ